MRSASALHCPTQGRTMAVKVILLQSVPNLGEPGDIKEVSAGYFRNFLQPRKLAVEATKGQLASLHATSSAREGQ
ncbi:MAG TPA: bL9 family ribosomal protein, partial [Chloroflexota bacterium]